MVRFVTGSAVVALALALSAPASAQQPGTMVMQAPSLILQPGPASSAATPTPSTPPAISATAPAVATAAAPAAPAAAPVASAPPPAPVVPVTFEPGLIGAALGPDNAPLWEYPIPAGSAWPYLAYAAAAPSPGLTTLLPQAFSGALDISTVGDWGLRLRVDGLEKSYNTAKTCAVKLSIEGTDVAAGVVNSRSPVAMATLNLPDTGLYALAATVNCTGGLVEPLMLALETRAPGRDAWERPALRRPSRPLANIPAASDNSGNALTIRKGGAATAGVRWLQQVRLSPRPNYQPNGQLGDVVAEVPITRADALPLGTYKGFAKPEGSYLNDSNTHAAVLSTIQTASETGRWLYYVSIEQPPSSAQIVDRCAGSLAIEGNTVIPFSEFKTYRDQVASQDALGGWNGYRTRFMESRALVGAAELSRGDYKITVTVDCRDRPPHTARVWVKGPSDKSLRPLRAEEVKVQVVGAAPATIAPGGAAATMGGASGGGIAPGSSSVTVSGSALAGIAPGGGTITTSAATITDTLKAAAGAEINLTVNFATGSDVIEDQGRAQIAEIAAALRTLDTIAVVVEGHTDSVGDDASNLDLSKRRAAAVVKELTVIHKIDAARLSAAGYGKSKPIADNATDAGRARNRRVTIKRT